MIVRTFLFARLSRTINIIGGKLTRLKIFVQVDGLNVDHALSRLVEHYPTVEKSDWDMLEELDPENDIGALGEKLPPYRLH